MNSDDKSYYEIRLQLYKTERLVTNQKLPVDFLMRSTGNFFDS